MCCLTHSHPHAHNVWLSGGRLWSQGAPLDRFRESGKGEVAGGKETFFASPRYSLCPVCTVLSENTNTCTLKLINTTKTKKEYSSY